MFFIFDQLWSHWGFNFREIFLGYSFVCLLALSISVFLWPDATFTFQEQILEVQKPDQLTATKIGPIRAPSMFKKVSISRTQPSSSTTAETSGTTTTTLCASFLPSSLWPGSSRLRSTNHTNTMRAGCVSVYLCD